MSKSLTSLLPAKVRTELGTILAQGRQSIAERDSQETRRKTAKSRTDELLRRRDDLARMRLPAYDASDRSRIDRLLAGNAEEIGTEEATQRLRHNEQIALQMSALEGDAELLAAEVGTCARRIKQLESSIAENERRFLLELQSAIFNAFKAAATDLVMTYLAPMWAVNQIGEFNGTSLGSFPAQSAPGHCRIGWSDRIESTTNGRPMTQEVPVMLWPAGGHMPDGEKMEPRALVSAIRAELERAGAK